MSAQLQQTDPVPVVAKTPARWGEGSDHGSRNLREMTVKHRQVASLLAQGTKRDVICELTGYSSTYITWLIKDPLFKEYMRDMSEFVDAQIEAMYTSTADAIRDGLTTGNMDERLKSARLQLELTGRIGKGDRPNAAVESSVERLNSLADRLLALQSNVRRGATYDGEVQVGAVQSQESEGSEQ